MRNIEHRGRGYLTDFELVVLGKNVQIGYLGKVIRKISLRSQLEIFFYNLQGQETDTRK